jgi:PAS domain S-box-containing protein/putative nucleotidyltransferase with HDIG domain
LPGEDGGSFHLFIHNIGSKLFALRRVTRLQGFYLFLSNVNAAIFNVRDHEEILVAVCECALKYGGFALAWAGKLDESSGRVLPVAARGEAAQYVNSLVITTDPDLATSHGPTRMSMVDGTIHFIDDFQENAATAPWHAYGLQYGLNASAAVPVVVDGKALAVLNFYSSSKGFFDLEMRISLQEVARNVSLAFQVAQAEKRREQSFQAHRQSEERFRRVFDASPLPMQIISLADRQMRSLNVVHERTFGYSIDEIPNEEAWFARVYPDPVVRDEMRNTWNQFAIPSAIEGGPGNVVASPAITLVCKDGTRRIMRGFMSVVADDIVVQWEDLTEIKAAEEKLQQDEARFRNLIEQTLTGIYVTQDSKIAYANPRFCEILSLGSDELVGKNPLDCISQTPESRKLLSEESARIQAGGQGRLIALPFRTREGKDIELGMQANIGLWNGKPALIVISQDITERHRAEEKIAVYVKQLEGTMRGTLQAVANMVDLRDPYTSGHERRVGIIASDIAREMGWSEERCQNLQLIGLVHDIGKIAIPAEILSKPTRLTALEYEMVKTHAQQGYEILKDVEFPLPIAEIIREHHERMDGSGYPQGLKGEEILPEARILAVADVLESIASHRPYRPALGVDVAIEEIEKHRGIWFDPDVVDATLRLIREKGYLLPS